jgi:hypothetical protein
MIPKKSDNPKGLHQRYHISKSNGKPVDPKAEYFVLRIDENGKDPKHIEACRKAVITYAENIRECLPELADDLIERYGTKQCNIVDVSHRIERRKVFKVADIRALQKSVDVDITYSKMVEIMNDMAHKAYGD